MAPSLSFALNLPRLNDVFRITTHNSYWIKRSPFIEAFSTGAQENLLDQLFYENVRGIEIDIHKDKKNKGQWKVFHTERKKNSQCNPFSACLEKLKEFHYALPEHEIINVVIELKEIIGKNFDKDHTPADLDLQIESVLGPLLFKPKDFLKNCPRGMSLRQCAKDFGHPTIKELRGKFLFTVLGNWRWCRIGHGVSGWATYANYENDITKRTAFPHESDWGNYSKEKCGEEYIPFDQLKYARDNSLFMQVENVVDPKHLEEIAIFLNNGGLVRAHDAYTKDEQAHRFGLGMHNIQTDYPWIQYLDKGKRRPFRPLREQNFPDESVFYEPGSKFLFKKSAKSAESIFAFQKAGRDKFWFESHPSATRTSPKVEFSNQNWAKGKGCLSVSSDSNLQGGNTETLSLCRQTREAHGKFKIGEQEVSVLSIEGKINGETFYSEFKNVGDLIRVDVDKNKIKLSTLDKISTDFKPVYKLLGEKSFTHPPLYLGFLAKYGDVLFVGNRSDQGILKGNQLQLSLDQNESGYSFIDESWPL